VESLCSAAGAVVSSLWLPGRDETILDILFFVQRESNTQRQSGDLQDETKRGSRLENRLKLLCARGISTDGLTMTLRFSPFVNQNPTFNLTARDCSSTTHTRLCISESSPPSTIILKSLPSLSSLLQMHPSMHSLPVKSILSLANQYCISQSKLNMSSAKTTGTALPSKVQAARFAF